MNTYNATPTTNMTFSSSSYSGKSLLFSAGTSPKLIIPYIPIVGISFTVDLWLYATALQNIFEIAILGMCGAAEQGKCFVLTMRQTNSSFYVYIGFFYDDCQGSTPITTGTWLHIAVVFDKPQLRKQIYLNGRLEQNCTSFGSLNSPAANFTIGYLSPYGSISNLGYLQV